MTATEQRAMETIRKKTTDPISDSDMQTEDSSHSSNNATPNVEFVRQQRFEVGPRYTDLKFIGEGAYGK